MKLRLLPIHDGLEKEPKEQVELCLPSALFDSWSSISFRSQKKQPKLRLLLQGSCWYFCLTAMPLKPLISCSDKGIRRGCQKSLHHLDRQLSSYKKFESINKIGEKSVLKESVLEIFLELKNPPDIPYYFMCGDFFNKDFLQFGFVYGINKNIFHLWIMTSSFPRVKWA